MGTHVKYDFHKKNFRLLKNSETGEVDTSTIFKYSQQGNIVTAEYQGGTIKEGKILATLENNHLDMLYHCVTTEGELKAGKAKADISLNQQKKIVLHLQWQWLDGTMEKGESSYIEC